MEGDLSPGSSSPFAKSRYIHKDPEEQEAAAVRRRKARALMSALDAQVRQQASARERLSERQPERWQGWRSASPGAGAVSPDLRAGEVDSDLVLEVPAADAPNHSPPALPRRDPNATRDSRSPAARSPLPVVSPFVYESQQQEIAEAAWVTQDQISRLKRLLDLRLQEVEQQQQHFHQRLDQGLNSAARAAAEVAEKLTRRLDEEMDMATHSVADVAQQQAAQAEGVHSLAIQVSSAASSSTIQHQAVEEELSSVIDQQFRIQRQLDVLAQQQHTLLQQQQQQHHHHHDTVESVFDRFRHLEATLAPLRNAEASVSSTSNLQPEDAAALAAVYARLDHITAQMSNWMGEVQQLRTAVSRATAAVDSLQSDSNRLEASSQERSSTVPMTDVSSRRVGNSDALQKRVATLERVVGQMSERAAKGEEEQIVAEGTPVVQRWKKPSSDRLPTPQPSTSAVDEGGLSAKIASLEKLLVAQGKRIEIVEQTKQAERRSFATQIESMAAKRSLDVQAVEERIAALEQAKSRRPISKAHTAAIDEARSRLDAVEEALMKETVKLHRLELKVQDVLAKQPEEQEAASARRQKQRALMSALDALSKEPTG